MTQLSILNQEEKEELVAELGLNQTQRADRGGAGGSEHEAEQDGNLIGGEAGDEDQANLMTQTAMTDEAVEASLKEA